MGVVLLAEGSDVMAQGGERFAAILDEHGGAGAARQGFQTERAGSGKAVEYALAVVPGPDSTG